MLKEQQMSGLHYSPQNNNDIRSTTKIQTTTTAAILPDSQINGRTNIWTDRRTDRQTIKQNMQHLFSFLFLGYVQHDFFS